MSNRKRMQMRLEETGLRILPAGDLIAHNAAGEIIREYPRRHTRPPLDIWFGKGTPAEGKRSLNRTLYDAGVKYAEMWRNAYEPRSPAHSDTTRQVVDGSSAPPEPHLGNEHGLQELHELWRIIKDGETIHMLNQLCGEEWWPEGDKRRFKRICRKGLEVLAVFWRKR